MWRIRSQSAPLISSILWKNQIQLMRFESNKGRSDMILYYNVGTSAMNGKRIPVFFAPSLAQAGGRGAVL
ncbi:MAG: hypothetical protein D3914_06055 [Candidatus Electrothrix sp. LOE2]|nr:hypothetical protein [Candidatus Electrothrix sp. LOE2]